MQTVTLISIVGLLLAIAFFVRIWSALPKKRKVGVKNSRYKKNPRTMIVIGSGGHTSEMFSFLSTIDLQVFSPRCYVVASTDVGVNGGENKAVQFESQFSSNNNEKNFEVKRIFRSREVGQSYVTSIFTTLRALFSSVVLMWNQRPDLLLCNGPGTCVPLCMAAFLFKVLGLKDIRIVFAESFARVDELSLSGKILYHFADRFFVHWKELLRKYPRSEYIGRLADGNTNDQKGITIKEPKNFVLVTIGSTGFDELMRTLDSESFFGLLKKKGFKGLHLQIGRGDYFPSELVKSTNDPKFEYKCFRYLPSMEKEMTAASLVISHAGTGSIIETLSSGTPLIVVPNESLMANHQIQVAQKLEEEGFLLVAKLQQQHFLQKLESLMDRLQSKPLKPFPPEQNLLSNYLNGEFGIKSG